MNAAPFRSRKATLAIRHSARSRQETLISLLSPPLLSGAPSSPFDCHVDGLIHSSDFFEQQLFLVEQDHHFFRSEERNSKGREDRGGGGERPLSADPAPLSVGPAGRGRLRLSVCRRTL